MVCPVKKGYPNRPSLIYNLNPMRMQGKVALKLEIRSLLVIIPVPFSQSYVFNWDPLRTLELWRNLIPIRHSTLHNHHYTIKSCFASFQRSALAYVRTQLVLVLDLPLQLQLKTEVHYEQKLFSWNITIFRIQYRNASSQA